jgi:DNA-binding XRE family transcriptional regulator
MAEYREIEAGERWPNWETFHRICELFGWPLVGFSRQIDSAWIGGGATD